MQGAISGSISDAGTGSACSLYWLWDLWIAWHHAKSRTSVTLTLETRPPHWIPFMSRPKLTAAPAPPAHDESRFASQLALCKCRLWERGCLGSGFNDPGLGFLDLPPTCLACLRPPSQILEAVEHLAGLVHSHPSSKAMLRYIMQQLRACFQDLKLMLLPAISSKGQQKLSPEAARFLSSNPELLGVVRQLLPHLQAYILLEPLAQATCTSASTAPSEAMSAAVRTGVVPALDLVISLHRAATAGLPEKEQQLPLPVVIASAILNREVQEFEVRRMSLERCACWRPLPSACFKLCVVS